MSVNGSKSSATPSNARNSLVSHVEPERGALRTATPAGVRSSADDAQPGAPRDAQAPGATACT